jgi:hypothetical protein
MYAWCQDMPGVSAADYAEVVAELGGVEKHAAGRVAHVAGPVAGGFRIVDVWESKEAAERFHRDFLRPAVTRAHGDRGQDVPAGFRVFDVTD